MITLTTDFGSPYPAALKGAILRRCDARLVDVAHDLPRGDVRAAAFWLRELLPAFPPAVHLVAVDPEVSPDRRTVAVRAGDHVLVGPDDGVLLPPARALAHEETGDAADEDGPDTLAVFEVDRGTGPFHARDVLAPVAADVHEAGVAALSSLHGLAATDEFVDLSIPDPDIDGRTAVGEVVAVDGFGNAITNVPASVLDGLAGESVLVNGRSAPVGRRFADVDAGERVVRGDDLGYVELCVNGGRGDEAFDASSGDRIRLALPT